MDQEKKIEQTFKEYQDVAKENPNVDVAALMLSTLQNHDQNMVSSKWKKWAYTISLGMPPVGFLFALKFYFDDKEDARSVANTCIVLTVISVVFYVLLSKMIFSSSGASLQQIQQIKPSDIQQLYQ
jgi:hypothetical protein